MTNLGSMIWPVLTLILSNKLGMDAATIALFMVINTLVAVPMTLLGGKLADTFNKKTLIIIFDLLSVSGYIYAAFAPMSLPTIIVFMAASMFQSIEYASYDALVADLTTSKDRDRAYSLTYLGANLGLVLAPTLGGLLFNNYLNIAFLINGASIALSTLLIFLLIKNTEKEKNELDDEYEQDLGEKTNIFKYIFGNSVLILFILYGGLENGFYSMYNYLLPLDLAANYGDNGSVIFGTLSSLNCITVVVFTAAITALLKKYFDTTKVLLGMVLFLIGYGMFFGLINFVAFNYIAMVIFTWGEIIVTITMSPFLTRRIPASHRGRLMAFTNIFGMLFGSLITLGIGKVYDAGGRVPAWITVISIGILSLGILILMRYFDKKKYKNLYHSVISSDGCVISVRSANETLIKEYAKAYKFNSELNSEILYNELNYNSDIVNSYLNKVNSDSNNVYFFLMSDATPIGQIVLSRIDNSKCVCVNYLSNPKFLNKGYEEASRKIVSEYATKKFNLEIESEENVAVKI